MRERERLIAAYFAGWLHGDAGCLDECFAPEIVYGESDGAEYRGLVQLKRWFAGWQPHGAVLAWDIRRYVHQQDTTAVEWFFACRYDGVVSAFDGVSMVDFDSRGKIIQLREFAAQAERRFPFAQEATAE